MAGLITATLSLGLLLTACGDFLQQVGIDTPRPLTEDMLVHTSIHTHGNSASTRVLGRYFFMYWKGTVRVYTDCDEAVFQIMSRNDPGEMNRLARTPSIIDEEQARQVACEVFSRVGHRNQDYDPPVVHPFTYQPDEFDPTRVLLLPYFKIQWALKGFPRTGDPVLDPSIEMVISGQTGRLIYYSSASLTTHPEPPMTPEPIAKSNGR